MDKDETNEADTQGKKIGKHGQAKMKIINIENKHTLLEYQIMLKFQANVRRNKQLYQDKLKNVKERKSGWAERKKNATLLENNMR